MKVTLKTISKTIQFRSSAMSSQQIGSALVSTAWLVVESQIRRRFR